MKTKLIDIKRTNAQYIASLAIDEKDYEKLKDAIGTEYELQVITNKRSLNANAYFHVLVNKIAEKINRSSAYVKNDMLIHYGQYEYIDGMIPTYLIKAEYLEQLSEKTDVHFEVIGWEHMEGDSYIRCALKRGSHTYDIKEMARLIEGTVNEAKALGIETLSPYELELMTKRWQL